MAPIDVVYWEPDDPTDPVLHPARRLYEETLPAAERIPWEWIASAARRRRSRSGGWSPHLLLAGPAKQATLSGLGYGAHIEGYGGYLCYICVAPPVRGHGLGTQLMLRLMDAFHRDAAELGAPLPFVIWESHRPNPSAAPSEWEQWRARLRLFERVGGRWIDGVTFLAPNFARRGGAPVELQLFLVPVAEPEYRLDAEALRDVVAGLHQNVYGRGKGDRLFDRTLPPSCQPRLRPGAEAGPVPVA